jgi:hypothetical protein
MTLSNGSWPRVAVFSVLLVVLTLAGCSQRESLPATNENATADEHLPFAATSDKDGIFPTGSLTPTAIPAGTPVTIHLQLSLSSATSRAGDSFEAVLDQPIIVRGQVVALRGAVLVGKVLDARASDQLQEPGYMRLALTAISINGKSFPIQTSSIFVKRGAHGNRNSTVIGGASMSAVSTGTASISKTSIGQRSAGSLSRNSKGVLIGTSARTVAASEPVYAENLDVGVAPARRLTFRLAQPLPLGF